MNSAQKIMIVTGEDSGDSHGASLVEALRVEAGERGLRFFGATGLRMREAGVETVVNSDDFGIFGVLEVIREVPKFLGVMNKLVRAAEDEDPDLIILVDFPEFNLKLAKKLKKRGFRVVYYISPQLWAWRSYRIRGIRKHVDLLLTILPFEKDWYEKRGVDHVRYVGNPLSGKVKPALSSQEFCQKHGISGDNPLIALLPGSRGKEIERNLPIMLSAAKLLADQKPLARFGVGLARSRSKKEIDKFLLKEDASFRNRINIISRDIYSLLNASRAAAVASGTATLEAALIGTPQVIVYKTSAINALLLRPFVSISEFGLANLIAGEKVYRELIQDEFTASALASELERLLNPEINAKKRRQAAAIAKLVGEGDTSKKAAGEIADFAGWNLKDEH